MNKKQIFISILIVLIFIFALQNTAFVIVKFLGFEFEGSLSLFLILSIILGVTFGSFLFYQPKKKISEKQNELQTPTETNKDKTDKTAL